MNCSATPPANRFGRVGWIVLGIRRQQPLEPLGHFELAHNGCPARTAAVMTTPGGLFAAILRPRRLGRFHSGKQKARVSGPSPSGRYWARTSDPQLVESALPLPRL